MRVLAFFVRAPAWFWIGSLAMDAYGPSWMWFTAIVVIAFSDSLGDSIDQYAKYGR